MVACLCLLLSIFCLEKYLSTFLWSHLFSPGLETCTVRFVHAVQWHISLNTQLFAQLLAHCWYLIAVIISRPHWETAFISNIINMTNFQHYQHLNPNITIMLFSLYLSLLISWRLTMLKLLHITTDGMSDTGFRLHMCHPPPKSRG